MKSFWKIAAVAVLVVAAVVGVAEAQPILGSGPLTPSGEGQNIGSGHKRWGTIYARNLDLSVADGGTTTTSVAGDAGTTTIGPGYVEVPNGAVTSPSTVTYAANYTINLRKTDPALRKVTLTGNFNITAGSIVNGKTGSILFIADASDRTLSWPAFTALGDALPTTVSANKDVLCSFVSTGTTAASVYAACAAEP